MCFTVVIELFDRSKFYCTTTGGVKFSMKTFECPECGARIEGVYDYKVVGKALDHMENAHNDTKVTAERARKSMKS